MVKTPEEAVKLALKLGNKKLFLNYFMYFIYFFWI